MFPKSLIWNERENANGPIIRSHFFASWNPEPPKRHLKNWRRFVEARVTKTITFIRGKGRASKQAMTNAGRYRFSRIQEYPSTLRFAELDFRHWSNWTVGPVASIDDAVGDERDNCVYIFGDVVSQALWRKRRTSFVAGIYEKCIY